MEGALFYFGKVILFSGVLFLYYYLFLRDKTFHHYNRFYLLAAMLVSLLLPLLKVSHFTIEVDHNAYLLLNKLKQASNRTEHDAFNYFRIFSIGFGLVSAFLAGRFFFGIFKILKLKSRFQKELFEGINFYQTDLSNAPFSCFNNLFWKNTIRVNSDLGKQILKHEMAHIEQKHTYDKIFIGIIKSIYWFNPFFYLIKNELCLIHEYLADKKAVRQSDTKAFARMLLASHFSSNVLPAASPLFSSDLKKRLSMLKTPKTRFSYARRTFALPLLSAMVFICVVSTKNNEIKAANIKIVQAENAGKKNTPITKPGRTTDTDTPPSGFPKDVQKPIQHLAQSDGETADLDKRVRKKAHALNLPKTNSTECLASGSMEQAPTGMPEHFADDRATLRNDLTLLEKEVEKTKNDAAKVKIAAGNAQERAFLARKQAALVKKQVESAQQQAKKIIKPGA